MLNYLPSQRTRNPDLTTEPYSGLGSDYDYDRRTSIHSRLTRTNSISLGSEYEGEASELSSYHNFDQC